MAEVPEEHIKKGDVDRLMAAPMFFNLTQHHLTGSGKKYCNCVNIMFMSTNARDTSVTVYLDAASKNTGGHLLIKAGVLLTVADDVAQLSDQQQVGAVLVQSFHQSLFCPHSTHHYRIVFVQRRQPIEEANELLQHLNDKSQEALRCGCVMLEARPLSPALHLPLCR